MPTDYRIQKGDCILTIADKSGVPWEKIWNHPNNAALKQRRKDPNILFEGDPLYVPDMEARDYTAATDAKHPFVLKRPTAKLRLRVMFEPPPEPAPQPPPGPPSPDRRNVVNEDQPDDARPDEPRKQMPYVLTVEGVIREGKTDDAGFLECDIPPNATSGRLLLLPGTPHETELPLLLGHLDPIDEVSGVKQRLRNLCFDCGDQSDEVTPDFEAAVAAFQSKQGLPSTGQVDDATRAAILKAHVT